MLNATPKQLIAAVPGWKILIGRGCENPYALEYPVLGWALMDFSNDPDSVRDLGLPKSFTQIEALVFYEDAVHSITELRCQDCAVRVFTPEQSIDDEEKADVVAEARENWQYRQEQRQKALKLYQAGASVSDIVVETSMPRDQVECLIRFGPALKSEVAARLWRSDK